MKRRYFSLLVFATIIGFTSCNQDEKLSQKKDVINQVTGANLEESIQDEKGQVFTPVNDEQASEIRTEAKTRITYSKNDADLGEVAEGTKVKHAFEFQNTGNDPLFIYSAQGSCGCTIPNYPKEPIAPGQKGKIDIEFDSNGRPGSNTKTVTVQANTTPETTTLTFTVKVTPK
jgi:outer membrane biosynthesis protein TonB